MERNIYRIIYITKMDCFESLTGTCYMESLRRHAWLPWLRWQMLLFICKSCLRFSLPSRSNLLLKDLLSKLSIWLWKLNLLFFASIFILKTNGTRWTLTYFMTCSIFYVKISNITASNICKIISIGNYGCQSTCLAQEIVGIMFHSFSGL